VLGPAPCSAASMSRNRFVSLASEVLECIGPDIPALRADLSQRER
jgi:hypothetical protein